VRVEEVTSEGERDVTVRLRESRTLRVAAEELRRERRVDRESA
jgi:hypothetical protein